MARFSPTIGATSATVPMVARSASAEGRRRATGQVGEQQLGDLERDAAAGQALIRIAAVGAVRVDERHGRRQDRAGSDGGR